MNINEMEAGREMDALVAEKIFDRSVRVIEGAYEYRHKLTKEDHWYLVPEFSTDIAVAWLVEERIAELGLIKEYCMHLNEIANEHWDAGNRQSQRWQLIHATPEDRCRAALMAAEAGK